METAIPPQQPPSPTEHLKANLHEVVGELGSDLESGLSSQEAAARLKRFGRNSIVAKKKDARWGFLAFLKEPMIWLLAAAAVVYYLLGEMLDAVIMALAVIPIAAIDVIIEVQTDKALEKLEKLGEPRTSVLRDGKKASVPSEELVPGDVVFLEEGAISMSDCAVISSSDAAVDESILTGESEPVSKERQEEFSEDFFNNKGTIFAGTTLVSGNAKCVVVRTGNYTNYGRIGKLLGRTSVSKTRLQKDIERIVARFGIFAVLLSAFLIGVEIYTGDNWQNAVMGGISLATAAIPEEFPVVFTLFLSLGMWRLAKRNALVKKLSAVETLGSVNVICSDKTGTMTSGRMSVSEVFRKDVVQSALEFPRDAFEAARLFPLLLMACETEPFDFMEKAIYGYAGSRADLKRSKLVAEYPFDYRDKRMSHVWREPDGSLLLVAKGSVEGITKICGLTSSELERINAVNKEMGERGIRVLAFAKRRLDAVNGRAADESGLEFVCLLGFSDPLREAVPAAVRECQRAGIRVVMLTGDHKTTAHAIARKAGIDAGEVIDGTELENASEEDFLAALENCSVFARVLPEQKLRIVEGLQKLGYSVAVTGDGMNDAPALKKADIGVAMGMRGTEVSKEAAAFVLLDDNFATIVNAIRNGRKIYDNLKKAFNYLIAFHVPIFISALVIPLLQLPLLLFPIHIVFLELILHPAISVVFEEEAEEADIMTRKPRDRREHIIDRSTFALLIAEGLLISAGTLSIYVWALSRGYPGEVARGMGFATMILGQILMMVSLLHKERVSVRQVRGNVHLIRMVLLVVVAYALLTYVPALARIMRIGAPAPGGWIAALGLAMLPFLFSETAKSGRSGAGGGSLIG